MNSIVRIALKTTPEQAERLRALQQAFAQACNVLAPTVQSTRCWNRVALHHMAYKSLRQQFPGLGSQMICNAIYSVSRTSRLVFQHPRSPFNIARWGDKPLPRLQFKPQSPVFFDRHTLSIKDGQISMFTLDGRMRFRLDVRPEDERRFRDEKLREIALSAKAEVFMLSFHFSKLDGEADTETDGEAPATPATVDGLATAADHLPDYVQVNETLPASTAQPLPNALSPVTP
ncbi:hypothetical protein [Aquabacterium sp.]|uniref:hypothetical protein n=1 Tax=Aquabacterium sp. TaxID=1872578 RepID=UPI002CED9B72|nr:hypothetical protein [Aquabacterium sp.]HSW05886.1 hypothetical protein [Aquabacterium sp.]